MIIAPSILNLKEDEYDDKLQEFLDAGIKILHLDIMDGKFVSNTTKDIEIMEKVRKFPFFFEVHLMMFKPLEMAYKFIDLGANLIIFHYEAVNGVADTIKKLKEKGCKVGISIKPYTKIDVIKPYLKDIDSVLVMSVEPGFGGQTFIERSIDKIEELNKIRQQNSLNYLIEVDGGVNLSNSPLLKRRGTDVVVMGSFLINNDVKMIADKVKNL